MIKECVEEHKKCYWHFTGVPVPKNVYPGLLKSEDTTSLRLACLYLVLFVCLFALCLETS